MLGKRGVTRLDRIMEGLRSCGYCVCVVVILWFGDELLLGKLVLRTSCIVHVKLL